MSGADPIAATLLGPDPNDSRVLGGTHALSSIHSTSRRRHCHDGWRPTLPHGEESVAGGVWLGRSVLDSQDAEVSWVCGKAVR